MVTIPYWTDASFGMVIPMFEANLIGQPFLALPGLILSIIYNQPSMALIAAFIQAGFSGWMLRCWSLEAKIYQQDSDLQRRERYEIERFKEELLLSNIQAAHMAELSERNRIAQELHDDVGHELTAAVLGFQAFEQLWKKGDPIAEEMFVKAKERLSNSAFQLRETVHNMKPIRTMGIDSLNEICNQFTHCPINFQIYGDTSIVPVYLWSILEPCLKEALTNLTRHAKATKVEVSLVVSRHIVRLSVYNDGVSSRNYNAGIGLRNLRQRAKSVGGNVSIDTTDGFRLICVLPIEEIWKENL